MSAGRRRRLDQELVRRGLCDTRQRSQEAIALGRVLVSGSVADRPSRLVAPDEPLEVVERQRFVSRGGEKLDAALDRFGLDVSDCAALDAGASTGGFTDCLLQRGAAHVVAVDVGHGQLDARLRADARVVVMERTHVRELTADLVATALPTGLAPADVVPVDVVTADLSFISLTSAVPVLTGPLVRDGGSLVLLVKPQFEVGRRAVSRGKGVIREPALWLEALRSVGSSLEAAGAVIMGAVRSPLTGVSGNTEFFVLASVRRRRPRSGGRAGLARPDGAVDLSPAASHVLCDAVKEGS